MLMGALRKIGTYLRHTTVCLAMVGILLGLYWSIAYSVSVHRRRRAERMLQQLAALQPGIKNPRSAQQIARDFGGRESRFPEICTYDLDDSFAFGNSWFRRLMGRTQWDYLGLRPWRVSVVIRKSPEDPSDAQVIAAVGWNRGFDMWSWESRRRDYAVC